ncbi:MAG: zf-HC2 domain-containing protein [Ruminococcus sp.]|jgi:hypothetical protein|nr:zf-HC2 domain-containing protein [Ruminococcus sp.]
MLSHNVVKDLLPGYIDGICSDETNSEIKEHLTDCYECNSVYKAMKEPELPEEIPVTKDLDYLKKIRKRNLRRVLIAVGSVLICAVAFVFIFVVGVPADRDNIQVTFASVSKSSEDENGEYVLDIHESDFTLLMYMKTAGNLSIRETYSDEPDFTVMTSNGAEYINRTVILEVNVVPELFGSGKSYTYNLEKSDLPDFEKVKEYRVIVRFKDKDVIAERRSAMIYKMKDSIGDEPIEIEEIFPSAENYMFSYHEIDRKSGE